MMGSLIQEYRGRIVDSPGDNIPAEFARFICQGMFGVEAVGSGAFLSAIFLGSIDKQVLNQSSIYRGPGRRTRSIAIT